MSTAEAPSELITRPKRAEARRNYEKVLAAARDAFAAGGEVEEANWSMLSWARWLIPSESAEALSTDRRVTCSIEGSRRRR